MSECDGAAVRVPVFHVHLFAGLILHFLDYGKVLRRESLIAFVNVDVVHLKTHLAQNLEVGVNRADTHKLRVNAYVCAKYPFCQRFVAKFLCLVGTHHKDERRAVVSAGSISCSGYAASPYRFELCKPFHGGICSRMFVGVYDYRLAFLCIFHFNRKNFVLEISILDGFRGPLLRSQCKLVAFLSCDAPFFCHSVGNLNHGEVVLVRRSKPCLCRCRRNVLVRLYRGGKLVVALAVRFAAAADCNVDEPCLNLQSRIVYASDRRPALHFHKGCRCFVRKPRCQTCVSCKVVAVQIAESASCEYCINFSFFEDLCLFAKSLDGQSGKLRRCVRSERTAHSSEGCTHTVYYYYFSHVYNVLSLWLFIICS